MTDLKNVSVVITSYNRWIFLKECINSFIKLTGDNFPLIIIEDSTKQQMKQYIKKEWGNKVDLIFNDKNIGQAQSMDKAYSKVNTKYILHLEDDYKFINNPNFIQDSISILEERLDIHRIWLREINNYKKSHGPDAPNKLFEPEILKTKNNVKYRMVRERGPWRGFSYQPSVFRLEDYKTMFPKGYSAVIGDKVGVHAEIACSKHANQFKYRAALLANGCCQTPHTHSTYK